MSKRRLTQQQVSRIKEQHQKRLDDAEQTDQQQGQSGLVISHYGKASLVEDKQGNIIRCKSLRNLPSLVCGDRVIWQQQTADKEGVVIAIEPRESELARPDGFGKKRTIAANINQILIVVSPKPELNEGLMDRYLAAAELTGIKPLIVFNKIDLLNNEEYRAYSDRLAVYENIGYPVIHASCKQQHGLDALNQALDNNISIFVGQSGVGKSSLVNMILPDVDTEVGDVSEATGKGKHTTTTARLYHLPHGNGSLIDSPGIREFGLWKIDKHELANGFREFEPFTGQCRFRDCMHTNEPGCAVLQAINEGQVTQARHESYLRILESLAE